MPLIDRELRVDVSVIVPCFRCVATIDRAVVSVIAQTVQPKELILVDDFSGDETLSKLRRWEDLYPEWIRVVALPSNQGAGMARNAGWEQAKGKFIAFLDADDSWHPQKLEIQYGFMQCHPEVHLTGHGHVIGRSLHDRFGDHFAARCLPTWMVLASNPFVTPSVMLRSRLPFRFSEGRRYMEDHLLWLEIALSRGRIVRLEAPLAILHKAQVGVSGLSNHMTAMSKADFGNYRILYQRGAIGVVTLLLCWTWVSLKLVRRALIYGMPRLWRQALTR